MRSSESDLAVCAVLSGNRNFEGRIHPDVRMNYLASPPLVVAYALAGTLDTDLVHEPLGVGRRRPAGLPARHLADLGRSGRDRSRRHPLRHVPPELRATRSPATRTGAASTSRPGRRSVGEPSSSYIRRPPFFEGMGRDPEPVRDIVGARVLAVLGDSITTDHISPAGSIKPDSPAGRYLVGLGRGVVRLQLLRRSARQPRSDGARHVRQRPAAQPSRARHRGRLTPFTCPTASHRRSTRPPIRYRDEGVPLVVLAGADYGAGSSRDWAAKGTLLLGVKAVLARSFERIHRSNLVDMGVLPLEFVDGDSVETLGLTGPRGRTRFVDSQRCSSGEVPERLTVRADDIEFRVRPRIDTTHEAAYYRHGGILTYVLRQLVSETT